MSRKGPVCVWKGCKQPPLARGLCQQHYDRVRHSGRLDEYPKVERKSPSMPFRKGDGSGWWRPCSRCGRVLPAAEFFESHRKPRQRREAPYLESWCRKCKHEDWREWWDNAPEEVRQQYRPNSTERMRRWRAANPGRARASGRASRLRAKKEKGGPTPPDLVKRLKSLPTPTPVVWLQWQGSHHPERSIRRRKPQTFNAHGEPEWGLYMERVGVTKGNPLEIWVLVESKKGWSQRIEGAYSLTSMPRNYRKFVFGCPKNHSPKQLGPDPGFCEQCREDRSLSKGERAS